jgi:hypothetical protein
VLDNDFCQPASPTCPERNVDPKEGKAACKAHFGRLPALPGCCAPCGRVRPVCGGGKMSQRNLSATSRDFTSAQSSKGTKAALTVAARATRSVRFSQDTHCGG